MLSNELLCLHYLYVNVMLKKKVGQGGKKKKKHNQGNEFPASGYFKERVLIEWDVNLKIML